MDKTELQILKESYQNGLLDDVLPFWLSNGLDREHGGVMASLDRDGSLIDTDKSVWQQGRFTWLLGELYNHPLLADHPDRDRWLEIATSTAGFIETHCFDPVDGRMWFHLTRDGTPLRKRRYAFSESFAAIAFGEISKATGSEQYATRAADCFESFVDHNVNPPAELAKFTSARPMRSIGFPMIGINTAQELRDSIGLEGADEHIDRFIEEIETHFVRPDIECVMETVGGSGDLINHFDGRTLNPGHAIEGAWFIMSEGRYRNDHRLIQLGCTMLDWMWKRGWDQQYGGILYFTGVDSKPVQEYWHDMKFWWPHNETIIATLMAYVSTGDEKYRQWHQRIHRWTMDHFPDEECGEWFGYLRRDGAVSSPLKGNLWKGPFHIPRMQLVCLELLHHLDKSGLTNTGGAD
ncbi:MAG: AGE family epimerase/isomerase [Planctomycetota bacterium]